MGFLKTEINLKTVKKFALKMEYFTFEILRYKWSKSTSLHYYKVILILLTCFQYFIIMNAKIILGADQIRHKQ